MHISQIDSPSDQYGTVSDVSRPLIYKLNQAGMQRSTYNSLHELLVWALSVLEGGIAEDLITHEKQTGTWHSEPETEVDVEDVATETPAEELTPVEPATSIVEDVKSLASAGTASVADAIPLTSDMLDESAEDEALEAEAAKPISPKVAKPVAKPK